MNVAYEQSNIEKLAKTYSATVSTIENTRQIPEVLESLAPKIEIQEPESSLFVFRIVGSLFILLALIFPPYVSLRKN